MADQMTTDTLTDLMGADANVIPCTCTVDAPADGPCARCDATDADRVDLDRAADAIAAALNVPAYVEQTGGGCATIYVGTDGTDGRTPVLTAGPGTYGWGRGPSVGSSLEMFIGAARDRFGDGPDVDALDRTMPEWHAAPVAWLVAAALDLYPRAVALPVVAATDADL